jgi:hypothetical protein
VAQPRFGPDESFPLTDERLVGAGPGLSLADLMFICRAPQVGESSPHPFFSHFVRVEAMGPRNMQLMNDDVADTGGASSSTGPPTTSSGRIILPGGRIQTCVMTAKQKKLSEGIRMWYKLICSRFFMKQKNHMKAMKATKAKKKANRRNRGVGSCQKKRFKRWAKRLLQKAAREKVKLLTKKVRLLTKKVKLLEDKIALMQEDVVPAVPPQPSMAVTITVHYNQRIFRVQSSRMATLGSLRDEIAGVIGTTHFRMIMEGKELRFYDDNLTLGEIDMDWQGEPLWVTE